MSHPIRVAVIGAGPAGFFATAELLRDASKNVHVDLFDKLPTPYGLVRHGVAPDHQKIKSISQRYQKDAESGGQRMRMFGNVEIGRDLSVEELKQRYHAILFSFGAQSNRRLGIPGEELHGVHPASVFVGWYNGHPECVEARYNFGVDRAVVVGAGNVGLDVARVLCKSVDALSKTDMSDVALKALGKSTIREVYLLGRQGPAQATFTPPELEELTELPDCDFVVPLADRILDARTEAMLAAGTLEPRVKKNLEIIQKHALPEARPGRRSVTLRFYTSPIEILGEERIRGLKVCRNRQTLREDGTFALEPTDQVETFDCGLLLRSVGYRIEPIAGLPFEERSATIPHVKGQVLEREEGPAARGLFVAGWAKRGPQGVIGTNKPDAVETVGMLFQAQARGELLTPERDGADLLPLLKERGVQVVSFDDWKLLDELELSGGREQGRPRRKFTDVPSMLRALGEAKMGALFDGELVKLG